MGNEYLTINNWMMKYELEIETGLLQAFIDECRAGRLPVHIQRGVPYDDANGTMLETVIIECPDTDFDFNAAMSRVINRHYNLNDTEQ